MNQKEYQMIFQIGANLASSFNTSFGSACKRLNELAKETAETSKVLKDVSGYQRTQSALEANQEKLRKQREEYRELEEAIKEASQNAIDKFNDKLNKQAGYINSTEAALAKQIDKLGDLKKAADIVGPPTAELTEKIRKQEERVGALSEKLTKQKKRYENLKNSQNDAKDPTEKLTEELRRQEERISETTSAIEKQRQTLDNYSYSLSQAGVNVNNLSEEQKRLQEQYEDFKSTREHLQKVGAEYDELTQKAREQATEVGKLIGVYAAAGAAFYKGAIEPAIEFESAYTGVLKTVDGTPEQLQRIKEDILDLSTNVPTAASDIAAVAEAAGQLGIAVEDITSFSSVMIDLGESTNLSADQAASDLAKFANITKMNADNYSNLGSVIVDLGNNFATTEADIVSMATRLASTGTVTGLSEAQIMAVSTALSSVGIEAEAGGSAVSKLLKEIDSSVRMYESAMSVVDSTGYTNRELEMMASLDGKGFKEVAGSIGLTTAELKNYMSSVSGLEKFSNVAGVSAEQFIGNWTTDSVSALSDFINGLNDTERTGKSAVELLKDMGLTEVRLSNAVLSLATSDGILAKATEIANTAWEENTALAEEAGKRYATTESQIQMAKNSINNAGIALGEVFTPYIAEAARGVNEFAQNTAEWVKENPNAVKHIALFAGKVGGATLAFKGLNLAWTGVKTLGKGIQKTFAMGAGAANLAALGISAVAVAGMAAYEWLKMNEEASVAAAKAMGDLMLYGNGAETTIRDLTASIENSTSESYKMAQEINNNAKEYEAVKDNIAEARRQLEYYDLAIDEGALGTSEVEELKKTFEDLAEYLKQDFTGAYSNVFKGFKDAVGILGQEAGIAYGEVSKLLNSFKEDYDEKVSSANERISAYLDKSLTDEGVTLEDDRQFAKDTRLMYELARNHSTAYSDYQDFAASLGGIDFEDEETAKTALSELEEYAKAYIDELKAAQDQINKDNAMTLADLQSMYSAGEYTYTEYKTLKSAFDQANELTNQGYEQELAEFGQMLGESVGRLSGQLSGAIMEEYNQLLDNPDTWSQLKSTWKGMATSWTAVFRGGETDSAYWGNVYLKHDALEKANENHSELLEHIESLQKLANEQPVIIPVETAYEDTKQSKKRNRAIALTADDYKIISAAYAGGTDYSADTFLAGENGAEIVTNARGYKVYTAEETKDIFDTYTQIVAILPRLQRVNAAAPSLSAETGGTGTPLNVTITIEQNISGGSSEDISRNNDELVRKIREVLEETGRDRSRRAFN